VLCRGRDAVLIVQAGGLRCWWRAVRLKEEDANVDEKMQVLEELSST
jgi:hypothetical protein